MHKKHRARARFGHIALSAVFMAALLLSGIGMFAWQRDMSEVENRVLASFPKLHYSDVLSSAWQKQVEDFATDQIPFRDALSSLYRRMQYALGSRELDGVLIGRSADGKTRLFEALPYDPERAQRLSDTLGAIARFAGAMQCDTVLMPVPSSSMVYGEDLPAHADAAEISALYGIASANAENFGFVPILQALTANRASDGANLYFRTDHHWTVRAAYAAYCQYCAQMGLSPAEADFAVLSDEFYGTLHSKALLPFITADVLERSTIDVSRVRVYTGGGYGGTANLTEAPLYSEEALAKKDKYAYFLGGNYGLTLIENEALASERATLLLFKDSFANAIVPYLSANYGRIVMIDPRYYRGSAGELRALIEAEAPTTTLFLYEISTLADDASLRPLLERIL